MRFVLPLRPGQVKVLAMTVGMQTILVTGASGFVGKALVSELREAGHSVKTLARSGADFNVDMIFKPDLREALKGCDAVIHLASRVHVMNETSNNPLASYRSINVEATKHLAAQAQMAGVKTFVFLSSIKVNGEKTEGVAFSENVAPAPEDQYSVSKREAERMLGNFSATAMRIVILRPPLVYGPGVKANFRQLLNLVRKVPALPFGAFEKRRSLIYVGNLTSAIIAALEGSASGIYAVSDGEPVSVKVLCEKIAVAMKKKLTLISVPVAVMKFIAATVGRRAQISRLTDALEVDSSGFEKAFGWKPPYTLDEGLARTIEGES